MTGWLAATAATRSTAAPEPAGRLEDPRILDLLGLGGWATSEAETICETQRPTAPIELNLD